MKHDNYQSGWCSLIHEAWQLPIRKVFVNPWSMMGLNLEYIIAVHTVLINITEHCKHSNDQILHIL